MYLVALLETSDSLVVLWTRASDYQYGPTVDLCVGHAGENVEESGSGNDQDASGDSGQVADGLGGVASCLLIAHPYVVDAGGLEGHAEFDHWEAAYAEHVFDSL